MRITLYFINFNDSFYIPFIHEHYSKFCQRIVMYDQYSTDDSVNLAKSFGMEVRNFGRRGQLNDQWYLDIKNHCWKECRTEDYYADYVIVCDADEFVSIPDGVLSEPHFLPKVTGFNMISESLPEKSVMEIKTGEYSEGYSKQAIFSPHVVQEINYVHGCHKNHMVTSEPKSILQAVVSLFHYRMIGGVDRMIERHRMYCTRMSEFNKTHKMGFHYLHSDDAKRAEWEYLKSNAVELW